jgi:hypothetical protein
MWRWLLLPLSISVTVQVLRLSLSSGVSMFEDKSDPQTPLHQLTDVREANRSRFELELEFVQALANPFYLHSLGLQCYLCRRQRCENSDIL